MALILNKWKNKVAVVTGASVGIGAAIAEKLVKEGLKVVVLTRRVEKVDEYAKRLSGESGKLYGYKVDITQDEKVLEAFNWVLKNVGPVSILVNNAGVYKETTLINGETQLWKLTLDTNVLGLSICTREAIKQMQANNIDGQIIHIGSIPVYVLPNSPSFNMYTPAKQAVASLTEMLRQELNQIKSKIKVSVRFTLQIKINVYNKNVFSAFNLELLILKL